MLAFLQYVCYACVGLNKQVEGCVDMFYLEETGKPFGPCETITESDWKYRDSGHRTYTAALKAYGRAKAEMHRACGQNGWSNHFRVIEITHKGRKIMNAYDDYADILLEKQYREYQRRAKS
jgi:hypothetical protein